MHQEQAEVSAHRWAVQSHGRLNPEALQEKHESVGLCAQEKEGEAHGGEPGKVIEDSVIKEQGKLKILHEFILSFVCLFVGLFCFVLTFQITKEWVFSFPPFLSSDSCANILACDCGSTTLQTSALCQEKSTGKQKAKAWGKSSCQDLLSPREAERGKGREKRRTVIAFTADSDSIPGQKETDWKEGSKGIRAISSHRTTSFFFCCLFFWGFFGWLYLHHQLLVLYLP